jgi:hypothetical protein
MDDLQNLQCVGRAGQPMDEYREVHGVEYAIMRKSLVYVRAQM